MQINGINYYFSNSLVLRKPALPICNDPITTKNLISTFLNKKNAEALMIASPSLHRELISLSLTENLQQIRPAKITLSLLKYHQRIKHRCTPFGLFAACSVIKWREQSNVNKRPSATIRSTRLDMHYSVALAHHLANIDFIKPLLRFFPNTSLHQTFDKFRFTEYFYKAKNRVHQISEVDYSIYLDQILASAENGRTLTELAVALINEDISEELAESFVSELVTNQILVSELEPSVSGGELLVELIQKLNMIQQSNQNQQLIEILFQLELIHKQILALDNNHVNELSEYSEIIELLKYFPIEFDESKLFQVDLFLTSNDLNLTCMNKIIQSKLLHTIESLKTLCENNSRTNLSEFKDAFHAKYEDAMIPLLTAIDNEQGIGYGRHLKKSSDVSELIDQIVIAREQLHSPLSRSAIQNLLTGKLILANQEKKYSVSFTQKEIEALPANNQPLPDSVSVMFSITSNKVDTKEILFKGLWGPSANLLLGRFASGSNEIKNLVDEIARDEEALNPDKLIAEIVHLPENRTGNILHRPNIRKYEIPYLSGCNLPLENQIKLQDLYIKINNNKIILWSSKYQKEVIPRMANAHNYSANALPIYHFLCDLQSQDVLPGLSFNWGNMQDQFVFLPRATIEDVIVFPATWQFKKADYEQILKASEESQLDLLFEWKKKWNIPDRFCIADGDNELVIHLNSSENLLIALFMSELKTRNSIILKEFLFDLENPLIKNSAGEGFNNEFVAPLIRESKVESKQEKIVLPKIKRTFIPGSEWLYFKIYCGTKTTDRILLEIIDPLCKELLHRNLIEKWFFIRYGDPDHHIRIRFFSSEPKKLLEINALMYLAFKDSNFGEQAHKIQTDTYQREIERYGEKNMELSEILFFEDSVAITRLLGLLKTHKKDEKRWLIAFRYVDNFLDATGMDREKKILFLEGLSKGFKKEQGFIGKSAVVLDKKHRSLRREIVQFLDGEFENDEFRQQLEIILNNLNHSQKELLRTIKANCEPSSESGIHDLFASYIHMSMNRLFLSQQRLTETLVYDFLLRYLTSQRAREITLLKSSVRKPTSENLN